MQRPKLRYLRSLLFLSFRRRSPESTIGPWQDQPHHSLGQLQLVKVDDQTKRNVQELHVTQELRFVDRQDSWTHLSSSRRQPSARMSKRSGSSNTRPLYSIRTRRWLTAAIWRNSSSRIMHRS